MSEFVLSAESFPTSDPSLFFFSSFCFSFTFLSAHLTFAHTQTWDYTTTRDGSSPKRCGKLTLLTDMCIWNLISHRARLRNKMLSSSAASCFFLVCENFCLAQKTSTREECTVRWVRERKSCFKFQISHSNKKKTEKWEWLMSHLETSTELNNRDVGWTTNDERMGNFTHEQCELFSRLLSYRVK